jgi:hypothetical protein
MGSEIIVLFAPLSLLALAYFIRVLCPPGRRLWALAGVIALMVGGWYFVASHGASPGTSAVVFGVLLVPAAAIHFIIGLVKSGFQKLRSPSSGA